MKEKEKKIIMSNESKEEWQDLFSIFYMGTLIGYDVNHIKNKIVSKIKDLNEDDLLIVEKIEEENYKHFISCLFPRKEKK